MRAVVESPRMTELNGIRADRVSAFSWALSSMFAGLAGRAHRSPLQHPGRRRTSSTWSWWRSPRPRSAGWSACPGRSSAVSGWACSSRWSTPSCPSWPTDHTWLTPHPGQPHAGDAVRGAVRPGDALARAAAHDRHQRPALRGRPATAGTCGADAQPAADPHHLRASACAFFLVVGLRRCSPRPTRRGCSWSPRPSILATDLPVDHGAHRLRRADLAVPGSVRRHRRLHGVPAGATASTCRCWSAPLVGALIAALVSGLLSLPLVRARHASGWRSPPWRSPPSSTRCVVQLPVRRRWRHLAAAGHPGAAPGHRAVGPRRRRDVPGARARSCSRSRRSP